MDDNGIFRGRIKLAGDGGMPYELFTPGTEKSSIPSFKMIPVCGETILHPNLHIQKKLFKRKSLEIFSITYKVFIVPVATIASPFGARIFIFAVP